MKSGLPNRTGPRKDGPIKVVVTFPRKSFLQKISSTTPIIISVLALLTAIAAQWQTIRHDRLSVKPHLAFLLEDNFQAPNVGLFIENDGLGPARIERFAIYFDGRAVNPTQMDSIYEHTQAIFKSRSPQWYTSEYVFHMKSGERMGVLFSPPANIKDLAAFHKLIEDRIFVIGQACSLYDECEYFCSVGSDEECIDRERRVREFGSKETKPLL